MSLCDITRGPLNTLRRTVQCSVAMVDVTQEMEQWAEWAALSSAALSAHYSISCVTSTIATLYEMTVT